MAIGLVGMAVCEEVVCSMFRICNRINEGWLQSKVTAFAYINDGGKPLASLLLATSLLEPSLL